MNEQSSDSNFNEMLSMLCEELMQDTLEIDDSCSPKNRIQRFLSSYYKAGLREFDNTTQSYANAYAFGSWLIRNYGGLDLVKEMMHNGKSNNDCIIFAVNTLNNTSLSFNELMSAFIKHCFSLKDTIRIFSGDQVVDLAASYGIVLKRCKIMSNGSVTISLNSSNGYSNSKILSYIFIE